MNKGVWFGEKSKESKRVLILGESHYDSQNNYPGYVGRETPYTTEEVVREYLSHKSNSADNKRWDRFFDKIAFSFGYEKDKVKAFYNLVMFGNYLPILCGVGKANPAKRYMKMERIELNNALFSFLNKQSVDILLCFSKSVYWNLPCACDIDRQSEHDIELPRIGNKSNRIHCFTYAPGHIHKNCDVILNKSLQVYGIRHPSARCGFDAEAVHNELSKMECLKDICNHHAFH